MGVSTIHFAGHAIRVGSLLRQRCAWCGEIVQDYDLALMAWPEGSGPPQPWPEGALVAVTADGRGRSSIQHEDGAQLPLGTCADSELATADAAGTVLK